MAVICAAIFMFFWRELGSWDLWLHIKSGELILKEHVIHKTDPYSFRALGRPWNNHQWLGSILLYGTWSVAGLTGLVVLRCVLVSVALLASWALARRRGVDPGLAAVLVLGAAWQLHVRALARPYLISFVMFMAVIWVLYDCILRRTPQRDEVARRDRPFADEDSYLWGPGGRLIVLWLWANLHAGFMMGLLLIGTFGVGELVGIWVRKGECGPWEAVWHRRVGARFRAMLVAGTACMGLAVVTPYGAETVLYPFRLTLTVDLLRRIAEWKPVRFSRTYALYWSVLGVGAFIMLRSAITYMVSGPREGSHGAHPDERLTPRVLATDLLLFLGFCYLPLRGVRHIAWILFLMPAILGRHLLLRPVSETAGRVRAKLFAVAALAVAVLLGPGRLLRRGIVEPGLRSDWYPVNASRFMERQNLVGLRLYNTYEWGGYLIWRWGPEHKVFIDGRCLVYRDDLLSETFTVSDADPGWRDVLQRWGVELVLFRYSEYDAEHFLEDEDWGCVYWDDSALVMLSRQQRQKRALPELDGTNPVVFNWADGPAEVEEALREIEVVLLREPACWTALAQKSRCLVARAEQEGDEGTLVEADELARRALSLSEAKDAWPWLAVYYVAKARGDEASAQHARERAHATRGRWLSSADIEQRLGLDEDEPADGPTPASSNAAAANTP
jgi:hypothetical protein